jgi:hypothetical protein
MTKLFLAAIAAFLVQAPASAQSIEVGTANWAKFPEAKTGARHINDEQMVIEAAKILKEGQCDLGRQQRAEHFDITVPYAVLVQPSGTVIRVLVSDMHCRPIEMLAGAAVRLRWLEGDFLPTGEAKARWYAGSLNFTME